MSATAKCHRRLFIRLFPDGRFAYLRFVLTGDRTEALLSLSNPMPGSGLPKKGRTAIEDEMCHWKARCMLDWAAEHNIDDFVFHAKQWKNKNAP